MSKIKHILIVDDSDADKFLAQITIQNAELDLEVTTASDGEEALKVISDFTDLPDVILLDINMPRMDGIQFLEEYNKMYKIYPPVVVMLTSSAQEQDREATIKYECVKEYLVKPLSTEKLIELEKLL